MAKRCYTLDIAKGIAIFLVVFGHIVQYTLAPAEVDFFLDPVFKIIYSFHLKKYDP